jgi:hypothetical protein
VLFLILNLVIYPQRTLRSHRVFKIITHESTLKRSKHFGKIIA